MYIKPWHNLEQNVISINFTEKLLPERAVLSIAELSSPHVILWYIGTHGLKKGCVEFYRHNLISPVLMANAEASFWLTDLTAWDAFKSSKGSINKTSSCCPIMQDFNDHRIRCLPSSKIFQRMLEIDDEYIIEHFVKVLTKISSREDSHSNHHSVGITVGEIFPKMSPIFRSLINTDVSKAYSAFQFLEGCLIVEEIVKWIATHSKSNFAEIVFALPNDELKYYRVDEDLFKSSVEILINRIWLQEGVDQFNLNLNFLAFRFGNQDEHRPYNIPGDSVKKNELYIEDVIGYENTIDPIMREKCVF